MKTIIAFLLVFFAVEAFAQDSHYNTYGYGSRSGLMGGAVTGGVRDTSAIFYNPGALGFVDNASLSVSGNAYSFETITLENGAGATEDLESEEVNVVPTLLSGIIIPDGDSKQRIGYGILTRSYANFKASSRLDTIGDVLKHPFAPGQEDYIGQYNLNSKLNEIWGDVSYAYKLSPEMSVGISNFLALRSQNFTESIRARAINRAIPTVVGLTDALTDYDYYNLRLLWKLGLAGEQGRIKWGFNLTTPSVDLTGDGNVSRDLTVANLDGNGTGQPISFVASDRQDSLDAEFRSPLGLSAGAEVALAASTNLGISIDWMDSQSDYKVLSPESRPFLRPSGITDGFDSADFLQLRNAASSVLNASIGLEHKLSEDTIGYLSFRTDAESNNDRSGTGFSTWDIYHIVAGASFKGEHSDLSLGVQYSFARQNNIDQVADFSNASEQNFLFGTPGDSDLQYDAVAILLGYTYYIE